MNIQNNRVIIAAGSPLLVLLIGVTALLLMEKRTNRELVEEFQLEKEDLENEYTSFARQYDELKLTVANDSLSVLLEQEQLKTQRLLEELRTVKSTNATEIQRMMAKKDSSRHTYYSRYTGKKWGDSKNYHLTLDSGALGYDLCVKLITEVAQAAE